MQNQESDRNDSRHIKSKSDGAQQYAFSVEEIANFEHMFQALGTGQRDGVSASLPISMLGDMIRLNGIALSDGKLKEYEQFLSRDSFQLGNLLDVLSVHYAHQLKVQHALESKEIMEEDQDEVQAEEQRVHYFDLLLSNNPSVLQPHDMVEFLLACFCMLDPSDSGFVKVEDLADALKMEGNDVQAPESESQVIDILQEMRIPLKDKINPSQFVKIFEHVIAFSIPENGVDNSYFLNLLYADLSNIAQDTGTCS